MDVHSRSRRVGLTAIALALVFRLWATGLPDQAVKWLLSTDGSALMLYLETGQDVRFSPSQEVFSPDFLESPPAVTPQPTLPSIPAFSPEEAVALQNSSSRTPDLPALLAQPLQWDLYSQSPSVLIVHTHGTESYTKGTEDYTESAAWRTVDEQYNMLSIGAEVARLLNQAGIATVQDRQLHDHPSYNGSYTHARKAIQAALEEYPGIQLVLDLHRDASGSSRAQLRTLAQVDGQDSAQLMLVLGSNHKGYSANLSLALKLHAQLERQAPGITRPMQLRPQRFNQDLCPGAVLVEVGGAGNTRQEALLAAAQLAQAVIALARGSTLAGEQAAVSS